MWPSACTLKEHWTAMEREVDKIGGRKARGSE